MIVKDRVPIYLKLAIEEVDCRGHSGAGRDCEYIVYDPSGVIQGELTVNCKDLDLVRVLHSLRIHQAAESVLSPVAHEGKPASYLLSGSHSPSVRSAPASASNSVKFKDMPADLTAGGLIMDLAEVAGSMDPFTVSMAGLIDDLLRPQK